MNSPTPVPVRDENQAFDLFADALTGNFGVTLVLRSGMQVAGDVNLVARPTENLPGYVTIKTIPGDDLRDFKFPEIRSIYVANEEQNP